jgi:hypothetical protein
MPYAPTADDASLVIPARPRRTAAARRPLLRRWDWRGAMREASVAGFVTLAASWALAEAAFALFG